jgi:predicted GIY-YIG superfamily endonuclease
VAKKQWSVYVVKLREEARERVLGAMPSLQRRRIDRRLPLLYVGVTALSPKRRYAKHREGGITAASIVHEYGVGLLESLYRDRNPLPAATEAQALEAEAELAEELRDRGYAVWGEHGKPLDLDR